MNKQEFTYLQTLTFKPGALVIPATSFTKNLSDRTLLYGYNVDRIIHHVYLINGFVQRYDNANLSNVYKKMDWFESYEELIPNKRLYPHFCDYDFCVFLKSKGVYLTFTRYAHDAREAQFYADIWSE